MPLQATVNLINRTNGPLTCTFDGAQIEIAPGPNPGFPAVAVPFAKSQNPLRGSVHPFSPTQFTSLVGVAGTADPVDPLEQTTKTDELLDRSKLGGLAGQAVVVPGQPMTAWEARAGMGDIDGGALASN